MSFHSGSEHGASPYPGLSPISEVHGLGQSPVIADITVNHTGSDPHHTLALSHFEKQPPDNMRKSNFFHFVISLFDGNHQPVEVLRAGFKDFVDTATNGQEYRNGLIYKLLVAYGDGFQKEEELHVRLIDSNTKQLVPYEGTCKNPDFRRVLLTHELICSRCLEHRSCGNKNDTPSDPILIDRYRLKFFVKCNQNCLKNAGNPKDSRRRFQVALYAAPNRDSPIGCSEAMFVHNNSKHGRKANTVYPSRDSNMVGDGKPFIISVHPHEGWASGGTSVCIVGVNFFEGTEVVFGTLPASSELISPCAIAVKTPPSPRPGEVDITLVYQGSQYCINNPGKFVYLAPDESHFEHNFARLERLLRNQDEPDEIPKDILLKRAADALETFYSLPRPNYSTGGAGPLNHIYHYPGSPALFAVAPHLQQPLLSPTRKISTLPMEGADTGTANGVSRCNSDGQPGVESNSGFFSYPDIKMEHVPAIHKPKPVTPGVYTMPFLQVAQVPGATSYTGYPPNSTTELNGYIALGEEESNRNNNNSNVIGHGYPMVANWTGNSIPVHLIPPSPLFTASPGPLPLTPNGSTVFNFPMISPAKRPLKSKDGHLATTTAGPPINYQQTAMLAALPSPGIPGTFVFPPSTPTSLIAPISLPDLSTTSEAQTSTAPPMVTMATDLNPPRPKKRRDSPDIS